MDKEVDHLKEGQKTFRTDLDVLEDRHWGQGVVS
jgi:hypothetical protein